MAAYPELDLPDYSALSLDTGPPDSPRGAFTLRDPPVASTSTAGMAAQDPSPLGQVRSVSPSSSTLAAPSAGPARTNPLTDLIATERLYVDDLASVIKRVAAAWSRTNFPPPHLDAMFRAIEAVYRINKALLGRLTEIGPSPSSPKLLGDLLMRWIDELEPAYRRYSSALCCSFDDDPVIQGNTKLGPILASLPPIGSSRPGTPQPGESAGVTIDKLFILPYYRLRYYKKLYAKLLKSTQPGRSDHRLLVGANDKLDALVALCDQSIAQANTAPAEEEEAPTPMPKQMESPALPPLPPPREASPASTEPPASSVGSSRVLSTASSGSLGRVEAKRRSSLAASMSQTTLASAGTTSSLANSVTDIRALDVAELERRLDTARTLDIFSMKPKKCRLQMQPPTLGYPRGIRQAGEVSLRFIPTSDPNGREVFIRRAYLILLTDLFLVCEPVAATERNEATPGADLWLLFPPLSGKHLRVDPIEGDDLAFDISVMRKEHLHVQCESRNIVQTWIESFDECLNFANTALRLRTESPAAGKSPAISPVGPSPSTRMPMSPAESSFSASSDRMAPPRAMSTASDPVGFRSRSADPDYLPPPPRPPVNGSNGYAPLDMMPGRRSSEGSALQPFRPPSAQSGYSSYHPMPPPPPLPSGTGSTYGMPPPMPQYANSRSAPSFRSNSNNMSRRTDPGLAATAPHFGSQGSLSRLDVSYASGPGHSMNRSRSADGLRSAPAGLGNGLRGAPDADAHRHYRAPSTVSPLKAPNDPEDEDDEDDLAAARAEAEAAAQGPVKSQLAAQMRCKVFLQQGRIQWKAVGTAKLRLYLQSPTNVKQLVVEQGDGGKAKPIISTIVLTDGVERVGKTGVAIELSDRGERTGIVYMLQMKTEQSATGLFQQLLLGSDRTSRMA